jgi:CheY-like chemotaxis protein
MWAAQLRRCSSAYEIVEAADDKSGLALYRSRQIDCVVLELDMSNQTGFRTLMELVPDASRPKVAVIVLTKELPQGVWELVRQVGAYACLVKPYTTGEGLDRAIQDAIEFVAMMPREDGHQNGPVRQRSLSARSPLTEIPGDRRTDSERQQNVQHSTGMES